jgi:DNA polymerase-3 subunit delta
MKLINLLISDEILLLDEACHHCRQVAKENGIYDSERIRIDKKYNWNDFFSTTCHLSLFSSEKIIELHFSDKPNKTAQLALIELSKMKEHTHYYSICLPKLDKKTKQTAWFKTLSANANVQELWPPSFSSFPQWLIQQAKKYELSFESEALDYLAEKTEGHLLAADQALKKLSLVSKPNSLDTIKKDTAIQKQTIRIKKKYLITILSDEARFSVFLCIDEALKGEGTRSIHMLKHLKKESFSPIILLANLTKDIQLCHHICMTMEQNKSVTECLSRYSLWPIKKQLLLASAKRLSTAQWQHLLVQCSIMDQIIKGFCLGDIWLEIESCLWSMSGQPIRLWGDA